jgi:hypothetical protein
LFRVFFEFISGVAGQHIADWSQGEEIACKSMNPSFGERHFSTVFADLDANLL